MSVELLNMDCMEYMAGCDDNAFDLAIVDPPYAVGASSGSFGNRGHDSKTSNLKHYANHDKTPEADYFIEIKRVSTNQIIWGANYYPQYFNHTGAIIWHKKNDGPLSDCEIAFQSFDKRVKYIWAEWQGVLTGGENILKRIHPNQKPKKLYEWLLKNYAKPEQRILDTHLGSASSAIAAHYFGCDFVGTELDPDYYAAAVERFNNETKQAQLFDREPLPETAEQGALL
jgi:site-specific DNA-methyltransferase (adenine-specific)